MTEATRIPRTQHQPIQNRPKFPRLHCQQQFNSRSNRPGIARGVPNGCITSLADQIGLSLQFISRRRKPHSKRRCISLAQNPPHTSPAATQRGEQVGKVQQAFRLATMQTPPC